MKPLWDVIVVGAGPGGCVLSTMLARCGRRVLLLDKDVPPRYHVGESLSLVACNLLDAIGAGGKVRAAGFVPKSGATFIWGPDPGPWSVYYGEPEGPPAAMQVRRDELDQILVRHAASSGVEVRQGCRVQEALFEAGRAVGVRYLGGDGEQQCAYAPWTVDASGQDALLARQLGLLEPHPRLRSTVVWSYWAGGGRLPGRDAGNALFIGQRDVCFWYVPLDDRTGLAGVGAVVLPSGPRLLDGGPERPERFYRDALSASAPLSRLLSGARQTEPVRSAPATAYRCSRLAGPGWVLTGDAACFVDPILTPGVELAASHGMLAACTLNTVLDAPALEAQALALYGHLYAQRYETFVQLCLNLYEKAEAGPQARAPEPSGNGQARPPAGGRAPGEGGDQMTFLTLVSGLSGAELPPLLGRYLALRGKAADRGGARVAMGEEEGLAFLTWRFHQRQLRDGRAGRIGEVLAGGSVVRPAPEVKVSDELFLPPDDPSGDPSKGAGVLVRRRAVTNRFRDRFQLTPELEALLTILSGGEESDGGRAWQEVERRFCERFGIARDAHRDALRRWVELLADHALVEWGPPGRPPAAAAAGREAS